MLLSDAYQSYWNNYYVEQMERIELSSSDWKSEVMTIIRHLRFTNISNNVCFNLLCKYTKNF